MVLAMWTKIARTWGERARLRLNREVASGKRSCCAMHQATSSQIVCLKHRG